MARKSRGPAQPEGIWLRLYFHPQRGAVASPLALNPICMRYRGGQDSAWVDLLRFQADRAPDGTWLPRPGQSLPAGFLWGDPARQHFGMGGPQIAFGPLRRFCRSCGKRFVFPARKQKHWLETLGFHIDSTAVCCRPCRAGQRRVEERRKDWESALRAAETSAGPGPQLALARAGLALLQAWGRAPLDKAVAACRRAQRLGAGAEADRVLEELRALRAEIIRSRAGR
jgi:hypothetical protein